MEIIKEEEEEEEEEKKEEEKKEEEKKDINWFNDPELVEEKKIAAKAWKQDVMNSSILNEYQHKTIRHIIKEKKNKIINVYTFCASILGIFKQVNDRENNILVEAFKGVTPPKPRSKFDDIINGTELEYIDKEKVNYYLELILQNK